MKSTKPIIFCDFDGVLCRDKYWRSLSQNNFSKIQDFLFSGRNQLVDDWMIGKHSAEEINEILAREIKIPFDELWDIFVKDCRTMKVSQETLQKLQELRGRYVIILITGNMDSFSRFTQSSLRLDNYFDHISNSFYEGVNKVDNGGETFLKYLNKFNSPIKESIVLDDSPKVCSVFQKLGGSSYLITVERNIDFYLKTLADRGASTRI